MLPLRICLRVSRQAHACMCLALYHLQRSCVTCVMQFCADVIPLFEVDRVDSTSESMDCQLERTENGQKLKALFVPPAAQKNGVVYSKQTVLARNDSEHSLTSWAAKAELTWVQKQEMACDEQDLSTVFSVHPIEHGINSGKVATLKAESLEEMQEWVRLIREEAASAAALAAGAKSEFEKIRIRS